MYFLRITYLSNPINVSRKLSQNQRRLKKKFIFAVLFTIFAFALLLANAHQGCWPINCQLFFALTISKIFFSSGQIRYFIHGPKRELVFFKNFRKKNIFGVFAKIRLFCFLLCHSFVRLCSPNRVVLQNLQHCYFCIFSRNSKISVHFLLPYQNKTLNVFFLTLILLQF